MAGFKTELTTTDITTIVNTELGTSFAVSTANGTGNTTINNVIGNRTDKSFSDGQETPSLVGHLKASYYHVHNASLIYPRDADPAQITAGRGAWNEGTKVIVIAKGAKTNMFDIHHVILGNISANDDYVIKIYYGDDETFWGEIAFTRDTNQVRGSQVPIQGIPVPAGSVIKAALLSGNGSNNCYIKLYTHEYPN